ncbi:Bacterial Ig-like domain (group 2) [Grimontia celer]|uniref:Bacterial Ig-like domain (Group 2) n=1 Tax=Grimontia celer TaxID=1796497 RepID=A0A128EWK3_9GAMM|nr:Ig-like domain-containing protein [Grimontia celer]CZF78937.1 Bacterial Ig-like domain (group 2) [Grimontia celer]
MRFNLVVPAVLLPLFTACKDDNITYTSGSGTGTSSSSTLAHIDVTPSSVTAFTNQSFKAVGRYSDGTEADITNDVSWSSSNSAVADLDSNGLATFSNAGTVNITASLSGVTSSASSLTVVASVVCGHTFGSAYSSSVNNSDNTIASGACLKIAQDSSNNWFTSAPSLAAVDALDITFLSESEIGDGVSGPSGGRFMLFNWFDSREWCEKLASISFAGRTDWAVATNTQLSGLFTALGNMYTGYGWPVGNYSYWSATASGSNYDSISLLDGSSAPNGPVATSYSSCISTST